MTFINNQPALIFTHEIVILKSKIICPILKINYTVLFNICNIIYIIFSSIYVVYTI